MKRYYAVLLLLSAAALLSQDKPKPVTASMETENKILKAENALDKVTQAEQAINTQFMELQSKAKQLQEQFTQEQAKEAPARKAVDEAIEAAWKESGLDKSKFDFDAADFTFKPKAEQKAKADAPKK
jgi:outer membrane protein OmpA-like peptidoglycan-associated protein